MKIGIAILENNLDYFIHKSYIMLLKKYNLSYDCITLETPLDSFDGFLLPGGNDIDAKYYGQESYACFNVSEEMDLLDKKIIAYAIKNKKPLLGICRGIQSINVFLGGTLKQHILHHSNENHFIQFKNKLFLVNSFHHQSIDVLAEDLVVLARSFDNEIEIIRHKSLEIYGIQFHPELFDFDLKELINEL